MDIFNMLRMFSLVLITTTQADKSSQDENNMNVKSLTVNKSVKTKEKSALNSEHFARQSISLWPNIEQDQDLLLLEQVLQDIEGGRGKSHRYRRLAKRMYPLLMGVLVAKVILVPLVLKLLTAISVTAVAMSKIALITTGFVALKWILSDNVYDTKDHLEFIYLPQTHSNGKPWNDQSWSYSSDQYVTLSPSTAMKQQKYIPVNFRNDTPHKYSSAANGGWRTSSSLGNSVKDLYYYAQHNNYNKNDGKPFL